MKNLNKKPINLIIIKKQIAFCYDLPFGILYFSSNVDIESMNITSSNVDMKENKPLGTKSKQIGNIFKLLCLIMSLFKDF